MNYIKMAGGYELTIKALPNEGGSTKVTGGVDYLQLTDLSDISHPDRYFQFKATAKEGYTFDKWTWSGLSKEPNSAYPPGFAINLQPNEKAILTAHFIKNGGTGTGDKSETGEGSNPPFASPTTPIASPTTPPTDPTPPPTAPTTPPSTLDDLHDTYAQMPKEEILEAVKNLDNIEELMENPEDAKMLDGIEREYKQKANIHTNITIDSNTHGNFKKSTVNALGLAFNATPGGTAELRFSKLERAVEIDGTRYKTNEAIKVDINLVDESGKKIVNLTVPIAITVEIPTGMKPERLVILHYKSDGTVEALPVRINEDGTTCTFIVTSFSPFVFTQSLEDQSEKMNEEKSEKPAPIVPVLYDIEKRGNLLTFKTFIANASNNMSGAVVTVKLNDRYVTSVTIGANGVGEGSIDAPGLLGDAIFSARVNGISAPVATKAMLVNGSGNVVPR